MKLKDVEQYQVMHKTPSGGGGWAVCQILPGDYCRVVGVSKTDIGEQAFLAWNKLIALEPSYNEETKKYDGPPIKLSAEVLAKLNPIRAALKDGTMKVVNTRFTKA